MSLLIKALDKAEKAQVEQQKLEHEALDAVQSHRRGAKNIANDQTEPDAPIALTLADSEPETTQDAASFVRSQYSGEHTSARASNMFASKVESSAEVKPIVWIIVLGVVGLMAIVGYFYYQLNAMQAPPPPAINQPPFAVNNTLPQATAMENTSAQLQSDNAAAETTALAKEQPTTLDSAESADTTSMKAAKGASLAPAKRNLPMLSANESAQEAVSSNASPVEMRRQSSVVVVPTIASDSASIRISRNQPAPAVSPVLMRAYHAYLAGSDNEAQSLYKQVLQRDTRNIDAMLGLGAIAERQGRTNDAVGWYQKVLEQDPKNPIALSAHANGAPEDQINAFKLKQMLAENPNDANAHSHLGAYYAEQSQWAEAQQAYFEAYRLNASAENAFNLAVSLDQMGKPALALPYYQQALTLIASSPSSTIDIAGLQARMFAIQSQ